MFSRRRRGGGFIGLTAALVVAGVVIAQERPAPPRPAPVPAPSGAKPAPIGVDESASAGTSLRAKEILGAKVGIDGNTAIGTVDDLVMDEHGNVDYLIVVREDGQLVTIPWDAAQFSAEQRMATVHITPEYFQKIPTYTVEQYPVFSAPTYRQQTYQYFGLTPGQERRIVRRIAR